MPMRRPALSPYFTPHNILPPSFPLSRDRAQEPRAPLSNFLKLLRRPRNRHAGKGASGVEPLRPSMHWGDRNPALPLAIGAPSSPTRARARCPLLTPENALLWQGLTIIPYRHGTPTPLVQPLRYGPLGVPLVTHTGTPHTCTAHGTPRGHKTPQKIVIQRHSFPSLPPPGYPPGGYRATKAWPWEAVAKAGTCGLGWTCPRRPWPECPRHGGRRGRAAPPPVSHPRWDGCMVAVAGAGVRG